jgi:hypothetical protein
VKWDDERIAIEQRFITQWAAGSYSGVQYYFSNGPALADDVEYVEIWVINTDTDQLGLEDADGIWYRVQGFVQANIYVREDAGDARARLLADEVSAIYRRARFSYGSSGTITCRFPTIRSLGVREGRYVLVVRTPFYRDLKI